MTWTTAGKGKTNLIDVATTIGAESGFPSVDVSAIAVIKEKLKRSEMNLRIAL